MIEKRRRVRTVERIEIVDKPDRDETEQVKIKTKKKSKIVVFDDGSTMHWNHPDKTIEVGDQFVTVEEYVMRSDGKEF